MAKRIKIGVVPLKRDILDLERAVEVNSVQGYCPR